MGLSLRGSQGWDKVLARLIESQVWHKPAGSVVLWGKGSKKANGLCLPLCMIEHCIPVPVLMLDSSFIPYGPLMPFKLLPRCCSSEEVSLSKSICGFLKGNLLGLWTFLILMS